MQNKENDCCDVAPPKLIKNEDPAGLHSFCSAETYFKRKNDKRNFQFNTNTWLISHVNTANPESTLRRLPGHSVLVVEGLISEQSQNSQTLFNNISKPRVFVGYYHFVYDKAKKIHYVKVDNYDHHHYKEYYIDFAWRTWKCDKVAALKMIDNIKADEELPYRLAGKHSLLFGDGSSHNCTTWAIEQLKNAGIEDPVKWYDWIKTTPAKHTGGFGSSGPKCVIL